MPPRKISLEELMPDRQELRKLSGSPDWERQRLLCCVARMQSVSGKQCKKRPADYRLILARTTWREPLDSDVAEITGGWGNPRAIAPGATLCAKELARQDQHRMPRQTAKPSGAGHLFAEPRQRRCKEMFAELSNHLDDELDDSLCEELEKHMDGCEPCKAFLSSLEKSILQCGGRPNEFPDPRIAARVRRELMSEYQGLMSKITRHEGSRT